MRNFFMDKCIEYFWKARTVTKFEYLKESHFGIDYFSANYIEVYLYCAFIRCFNLTSFSFGLSDRLTFRLLRWYRLVR